MFARNALPTRTRAAMSENKHSFGNGFCSWNILLFHYAGKSFGCAYFQSKSRIKCCQQAFFSAGRGTKSSGATGSVSTYYATYADTATRPPADPISSTQQGLTDSTCYYRVSYLVHKKRVLAVGKTQHKSSRQSRGMQTHRSSVTICLSALNSCEQREFESILRNTFDTFQILQTQP